MPWLQGLPEKIGTADFQIITVHSPEFFHEHDVPSLKSKAAEYGLRLPIYIDNDHVYWRALESEGWPSVYLVDKRGDIRFRYLGETHRHFAQARDIEEKIHLLLKEHNN